MSRMSQPWSLSWASILTREKASFVAAIRSFAAPAILRWGSSRAGDTQSRQALELESMDWPEPSNAATLSHARHLRYAFDRIFIGRNNAKQMGSGVHRRAWRVVGRSDRDGPGVHRCIGSAARREGAESRVPSHLGDRRG